MLSNIAASTWRNMLRHRLFTCIVVGGLGAAFAAAIFISLFVHDKFHAESFVRGARQVYLVGTKLEFAGHPAVQMPSTAPEVAAMLEARLPGSRGATRRMEAVGTVNHGGLGNRELIEWVDPDFFALLQVPAFLGDPATALAAPNSAVLTRQMARKYFGSDRVLGRKLEIDRQVPVTVTAIVDDFPAGTSINGGMFVAAASSHSPLSQLEAARAGSALQLLPSESLFTYVKLDSPPDARTASLVLRPGDGQNSAVSLLFVPLNELHLKMPGVPNTSLNTILAISMLGLLVLFVAGINFVNLMIARAHRRAKEIGIRKVVGATRRHLVAQFVAEAAIYVAFALFLALALIEITAPFWESLLFQSFSLVDRLDLLAGIFACAALFAVAAGSYPALVLSSYSPSTILKSGVVKSGDSKTARKVLVAVQFAFLTAIVVCTVVVDRQMSLLSSEALRFDMKRTIVIGSNCRPAFVDEVRRIQGVEGLFCSGSAPLGQFSFESSSASVVGGNIVPMSGLAIDFNFFEFYRVRQIAGRLLSARFGLDTLKRSSSMSGVGHTTVSVVINESARRRFGFSAAADALGKNITSLLSSDVDAEIVGVVPDFLIGPIREGIRPLVFVVDPGAFGMMTVSLTARDQAATRAEIKALVDGEAANRELGPVVLSQVFETVYRDLILESVAFKAISIIVILTAGLGLVGLSIFNAQSRTKEIGVRLAMGASRAAVSRLLVFQLVRPVLLGSLVAWPAAFYAAHYWLQEFPQRIALTLPIFVGATSLTLLVVVGTVFLHSWQAAGSQASDLLRYE